MRLLNILRILIPILFVAEVSFAQENQEAELSIFDKISFQETLEVTFEMDMVALISNRRSREEHKASFSYLNENGELTNWNIEVGLRGKFRRTRCEKMPPLKLNFKKKDLAKAGLAKFDDLKLVTQCVDDQKLAKQLVIKEYMAYKLYNQITEKSFRVQFLKINFKDSKTGEEETQFGFLIEDTAQLRNRLNAKKVEAAYNLSQESFQEDNLQQVSVFQYMIGNPDWSIAKNHNLKILEIEGERIAVPYDFDFSGLVDAPYATLNEELNIKSQKERVYLGFEKEVLELENTLIFFSDKKESLIQVLKDSELLNGKTRRGMIRYLNSFFKNKEEINFPIEKIIPPTLGE